MKVGRNPLKWTKRCLLALAFFVYVLSQPATSYSKPANEPDIPEPEIIQLAPAPEIPEGVIDLADIHSEADGVFDYLKALKSELEAPLIGVSEYSTTAETVTKFKNKIEKRKSRRTLSIDYLNQELSVWQKNLVVIENELKLINEKISSIDSGKKELNSRGTTWVLTRDTYKNLTLEGVPFARIDEVIAALDSAIEETSLNTKKYLELQGEINSSKKLIIDYTEYLEVNIVQLKKSKWQRNSSFILSVEFVESLGSTDFSDVKDTFSENYAEANEYYVISKIKLALEFLGLLLLWLLIRTFEAKVQRRAKKITELKELEGFFKRSFTISFLMLFSVIPLFHPDPPLLVKEIYWLMLSVFLLVLLIQLIKEKHFRILIAGIWVTFILSLLKTVFIGALVAERILLLLQTGLGLAVIAFALSNKILEASQQPINSIFYRLLKVVRITLILILSIIFIIEILGFHKLSAMVSDITFKSIYASILIVAIYRLCLAFIIYISFSKPARKMKLFSEHAPSMISVFHKLASYIAVLTWLYLIARIWNIDAFVLKVARIILDFGVSIGENKITIGVGIGVFLALYIAGKSSRVIRFVLDEEVYSRREMAPGLGDAINQIVRYSIIFVGIVTALSFLGLKLESVALIIGALGIGIGFGLQNIVNNFLAGLIMLIERPIKIGDVLELGGQWGDVKHVGIRATIIETWDHSELIVPNGDLLWSTLTNWSHSSTRNRVIIPVGVSYNSDPRKVLQILRNTTDAHPEILKDPPPSIIFVGFGDSSLNFEIKCFIPKVYARFRIPSELRTDIFEAFKKEGIQIPYPQRDVYIKEFKKDD